MSSIGWEPRSSGKGQGDGYAERWKPRGGGVIRQPQMQLFSNLSGHIKQSPMCSPTTLLSLNCTNVLTNVQTIACIFKCSMLIEYICIYMHLHISHHMPQGEPLQPDWRQMKKKKKKPSRGYKWQLELAGSKDNLVPSKVMAVGLQATLLISHPSQEATV